jgi:hypothetical protein
MRRVSIGIGVPVGAAAAACVIIGLSFNAAAQTQGSSSNTDLASACKKLGTTSFEQIAGAPTWITSATVVAANGGQAAYCDIKGHVLQHVGLQMRLPLEGWNNKLYMNGNHGLGGPFFMDECEGALARNYAIGTTDMGIADASPTGDSLTIICKARSISPTGQRTSRQLPQKRS